jgi:hypothetical protein
VSRIAEACARAGIQVGEDQVSRWHSDLKNATEHLGEFHEEPGEPPPRVPEKLPPPERSAERPAPLIRTARRIGAIDSELAEAVRRLFLAPAGAVRSVLFCAVAGDPMNDVAWRAAELLADQSGKRVAFIEDVAASIVPPDADVRGTLITRIGWDATADTHPTDVMRGSAIASGDADIRTAGHVSDLIPVFDFVILNAAAPASHDLLPLAREVESVVVVVSADQTPSGEAEALVATLRSGDAPLAGVILVTGAPERSGHQLFRFD